MVIGQICHGNLGGSSRVACRLANALSRRGHSVEVFSYEPVPWTLRNDIVLHARQKARRDEGNPLYWDWTDDDRNAFRDMLTAQLSEKKFDILHYHYAQPFVGILRQTATALGTDMPVTIGTLHGTDLTRCQGDPALLASLKQDLTATATVTIASNHMSELFRGLLPDGPMPRIVPNFVEDNWPQTEIRGDQRVTPSGKPVILHISNFRTVKDVTLLAHLFIQIHRRIDAEFWLVGSGPDVPVLRDLLDRSSAKNAARYLGTQTDPAEYFAQASILLSTSTEEGFGLAVLEAMASGAVVVATGVGGIPELVTNDVTGMLFEPHDVEATAARVAALLTSPDKFDSMRAAAIRKADRLRETHVIGSYEELYLEQTEPLPVGAAG